MTEWISVKDRLPETDGPCLICYKFEKGSSRLYMEVLHYYVTDPKPHFQHEGFNGLTVTHWMPLPEPPKEG